MTDRPDHLPPVLVDRFAEIVGDTYALQDQDDIAPYEAERRGLFGGKAALVLRPGSVEEVSRIMKLATETGTAIVPQSGNTGLVGGQVPDTSGRQVILSLSRLNRIRELDPLSNTVTVEAGVILENLHTAADGIDRLFPLSLASQGSCQIGGNLSSNAGGVGALVYGSARDLCLGVEVVLPTGEVFDDLRKLKKDNTGYDLKNLFVGAEGTLGVITAAVMKLYPKPKGRESAWIAIETPDVALDLLHRGGEAAGSSLTSFELIGDTPLEFGLRHIPDARNPLEGRWPWYVLLEISSGHSDDDARQTIEAILTDAFEAGLIQDAAISANIAQAKEFWRLREGFSDAQKPEGASIKHDISVPVASIPEFLRLAAVEVERVCPGARVCCFGHVGDGNLHYNVSQPVGMAPEDYLALYPAMNKAVFAIVRQLHGSFSAEHGIGSMKRKELVETTSPVSIDLMRRIKSAFDPAGIMNPGKVL
ncbi:FAD-binding oxidoreductase [Corticibacterium sp. UT-5YL-CI-8]|nr:FAD-binding oxidoreductase [Tianweitania sp. UT-5YL-CI-8]